jgi:DMSO/TMAO reductase YedYZ molybdopterin-dependent catalytic subunit
MLPPGQIPRADFPRFGLTPYAERYPSKPTDCAVSVKVLSAAPVVLSDPLRGLARTTLQADFHCVTTWSRLGLVWGGVRFSDFFRQRIAPLSVASATVVGVVLCGQDGYRTSLLMEDLMADDILLADELDAQPLSVEHGAPLRLIAPRHYGYKSMKHLSKLEFWAIVPVIKHGPLAFLDHPRARVALEERGRWFPGWLLRHLYRPLIPSTAEKFRVGMLKHTQSTAMPHDANAA